MSIVFRSRVFSVELEKIHLPDGREHEGAIVGDAPVVVLIGMPDAGHVILVHQYRHSIRRDLWEVPAGGVNPGETPDAAARREGEEETGSRAGPGRRPAGT